MSEEKRDAKSDHLLTPENSVLCVIDYQPTQVNSVGSATRGEIMRNIKLVAKTAKAFNVPIVLSTVNVASSRNEDTAEGLKKLLDNVPSIDRTSMNSWEDINFRKAVEATGRKKVIIAALWTEVCLTFPTLDMLREGYEVYPVVDAVGGVSELSHKTALRRVEQAGAKLITIPELICELQRDWNRSKTLDDFLSLMNETGGFMKM
jgi:nicotinamidase-related amidase